VASKGVRVVGSIAKNCFRSAANHLTAIVNLSLLGVYNPPHWEELD
jgi:hypothetical protein